jgi:membrane fusion protein (multidrug efflux system)
MNVQLKDKLILGSQPASAAARNGAPRKRRLWPRLVAFGVVFAIGLAAVSGMALWGRHRYGHVVSKNASVKGHIAEVGSRLDGVVVSVEVDAGDPVIAGQIIAHLDDRHLQAQVRRARSELERGTHRAEVERLAIEHERHRLDSRLAEAAAREASSAAQLEAARSRAEDARRDHDRMMKLAERAATSEEEISEVKSRLRTAEALVAVADAEREAAVAAHRAAKVEQEGLCVRQAGLSVFDAQVETARAMLQAAQADLEAALIRAPDKGRVARRILEPGASVEVGQPIISLWISEEIWVEAWIDEADLSQVDVGSPATVTVGPFSDVVLSGSVETIGVLTADELPETQVRQARRLRIHDTPVVCVRIRLEESHDQLFPGLSAVVNIPKKAPGFLSTRLARAKGGVSSSPASP